MQQVSMALQYYASAEIKIGVIPIVSPRIKHGENVHLSEVEINDTYNA